MGRRSLTDELKGGLFTGIYHMKFDRYDTARHSFEAVVGRVDDIFAKPNRRPSNQDYLFSKLQHSSAFGQGLAEGYAGGLKNYDLPEDGYSKFVELAERVKEFYETLIFFSENLSEHDRVERHSRLGKGFAALGWKDHGLDILENFHNYTGSISRLAKTIVHSSYWEPIACYIGKEMKNTFQGSDWDKLHKRIFEKNSAD